MSQNRAWAKPGKEQHRKTPEEELNMEEEAPMIWAVLEPDLDHHDTPMKPAQWFPYNGNLP